MSKVKFRVLLVGAVHDAIVAELSSIADVETVSSIEEAGNLQADPPDVIVLEVGAGTSAIEKMSQLRESSAVPLVVITTEGDSSFLDEAVRAGASGVVVDSASADEIRDAVEVVRAGGSFFGAERTRGILDAVRSSPRAADPGLTQREIEVLTHLFEGRSARQIATRLGLSERTVNTHVANVYRKLGASNRVEAIRIAMRMGVLTE